MVPIAQALITYLVITAAPNVGRTLGDDAFSYALLSPMMTNTEHEILTKFLKL